MTSGTPGGTPDRPAVFFADAAEFRAWLEANHDTASELWMGLRRKGVEDRGLTWEEAVPEALCFGWIDSVSQRIDDLSRRQRWTPRTARSHWSAVNIAHVERLISEGRMHPAGLAAYARRSPERTATASFESPQPLDVERLARLQADPAAWAFWQEAAPAYRRAAEHWVASAKQERTRESRFAQLLEDCAHGRLVPPQRYGTRPRWVDRAAEAALRAGPPPG
jgi:uncharacterized protein YdeI (YjbR/CyaY-like superfamily)